MASEYKEEEIEENIDWRSVVILHVLKILLAMEMSNTMAHTNRHGWPGIMQGLGKSPYVEMLVTA